MEEKGFGYTKLMRNTASHVLAEPMGLVGIRSDNKTKSIDKGLQSPCPVRAPNIAVVDFDQALVG